MKNISLTDQCQFSMCPWTGPSLCYQQHSLENTNQDQQKKTNIIHDSMIDAISNLTQIKYFLLPMYKKLLNARQQICYLLTHDFIKDLVQARNKSDFTKFHQVGLFIYHPHLLKQKKIQTQRFFTSCL
jgi:hypothetical protein